jgi:hypothetical protein
LNERCEDGFDDLGAAGSEIVTLSDQFVHFSHDFFVNRACLRITKSDLKNPDQQRARRTIPPASIQNP